MLGATLTLKALPSEGVALEKARCTETVCAAGKKGDVAVSSYNLSSHTQLTLLLRKATP
jgi:hypothetical protein